MLLNKNDGSTLNDTQLPGIITFTQWHLFIFAASKGENIKQLIFNFQSELLFEMIGCYIDWSLEKA